jgi:uncharacterized protein (DUF1800 family)
MSITLDQSLGRITRMTVALIWALFAVAFTSVVADRADAQGTPTITANILLGTGSGTYKTGEAIPVSAMTPPVGFEFSRWIVYGGVAQNALTASTVITPNPGTRYVIAVALRQAVPAPNATFPLTVYFGTGSGQYAKDAIVPITANAPPANYSFAYWIDPYRIVTNPAAASTTLKIPGFRSFVYPVFKKGAPAATVAVTVTGGLGSGSYAVGSAVTIRANPPAAGLVFDKWTGTTAALADATQMQTVLTVPATPVAVTATYKAAPVAKVAVTVTGGAGSGTYDVGAKVNITANAPPAGQVFDKWVGGIAALANPALAQTVLTVPTTPVAITATYKAAPATTVAVTVIGGLGTGAYAAGIKINIAANAPPAGQVFDKWTGATATLLDPTQALTILTVPAAPATVTATYKPVPANVVVTVTGGLGSGSYAVGMKINIAANAAPAGQVFDKWTGATATLLDATQPLTILTVPATPTSVAATYKAAPAAKVAVTVTGGTGSGTYDVGAKVTITANAAPAGQAFTKWTGTTTALASDTTATTVLTVPSTPAAVTATYGSASSGTGVTLTSHKAGDTIAAEGETIFGNVTAPATVASATATISTTGRVVPLDVSQVTGRFALRLFSEDAPTGATVTLTFERKDTAGTTQTATVALKSGVVPAGMQQVLGRLTFGATPALLNQVKTMGYTAWVNQQLNPATISDAGLIAMNPDSLLRSADEPWQLRESIPWWQMASAAYSQRQLQEVMTTFWNNHFWSIDTDWQIHTADVDEIKGFRTNAFGKFRELLRVSTKNPQMMKYLDNVDNRKNGRNENYAREVLELHTVGVNGGYGDADVIAVAKILTGWGLEQTSADGVNPKLVRFLFRANDHDTANKIVPFLNTTVTGRTGAAGEQEGEELFDILARHPKTREFVCGKLVELLVSDARPASFIALCTAEWERTDGNMKDILSKILLAPEYLTTVDYQRSKAKTPYEYMAGFIRNFGIYPVAGKEHDFYNSLRYATKDAGMDMTEFGVPTGFREQGKSWTNTASFIQKFRGITTQVTWYTTPGSGTNRLGTVNYTQLVKSADMTTAQAAAAYLLALGTSDRYRKDEYDAVVATLKGSAGFNPAARDEDPVLRKAVGLIVTLPSYQLQ